LVKIEASGLCGTDVHVHHGHMPFVQLPIVAGHEPVGRIVELGAGVTDFKIGDRVGVSWVQKGCGHCVMCQSHRESYCRESLSWAQLGGGNAELMIAHSRGCTLVPEAASSEAAAPIFCAGYTVYSGIRAAAPRSGDRIAVLGIGGLGHLGVQFAKALGHSVVALTSSADKKAEARELGADEVVVVKDHVGNELMQAGGADIIVSTSNSAKQVSQAIAGLRPEGRLVNLGAVDGPLTIGGFDLMFPPRRLIGASQGERRDLVEALALVASGRVKPRLELYPLDKINEVRDRQEAGKVRYRAVLQP
jgi:D-arabinose 1-dehydrogenase-like Zn-dependent alcohol dehydrogenase